MFVFRVKVWITNIVHTVFSSQSRQSRGRCLGLVLDVLRDYDFFVKTVMVVSFNFRNDGKYCRVAHSY